VSEIEFSEDRVLADARAAAGLEDFGDAGFLDGLRLLLETYDTTADFSEKGRKRNYKRLVSLLATRLRVAEAFRKHPEIRDRELQKPVVLTGLPRSGTSALFNLLGADPAARPLRLWEAIFPDPLDGSEPGSSQPDPRRDGIEAHYARAREANPEFTKMHYTSADTPEECVLLMAYEFCDVQMGIEVMMEPYASWFRRQDFRRTYRAYHDLLKMLDWQRPGDRWTLKAPAHMWAIDALVESFPDVGIVWTHRNPLECTASICSMTAQLMAAREGLDLQQLGPVVMDFYATSLERGLAAREALDPGRIIDVRYGDFVTDSFAQAERIYRHFELPMDATIVKALRDHVDSHPQGKHGSHDYELSRYGLTRQSVLDRFAPYVERFELPTD
jgi:hypothetical protein